MLAPDFRRGCVTPRALLEECLERIAACEPVVKAFVTLDLAGARASADAATRRHKAGQPLSPIDGYPVAVKVIIATADMPTEMNSPIYKGWRPKSDAACVMALRHAGASIVGKTVTTEFAIGRSGATTNPFDARRTPGGSSSGSAAAVASGMVLAGLGTQTVGSILRPASYCGVVGFKPTIGALPTGGIHLLSATFDHLGVIAASVEDAWRIASQISLGVGSPVVGLLAGASRGLPVPRRPRRLLVMRTRGWKEIDDETRAAFNLAVDDLAARGVEVVTRRGASALADLEDQLERGIDDAADILAYEMRWPYGDYITRFGRLVGPRVRELVRRGETISAATYETLLHERRRMQRVAAVCLARCDGLVTLASSGPAPRGLANTGSRTFASYASWLGLPAISLPMLSVSGLPVGLQLIGGATADHRLCAVARWVMGTKGLT